MDNVARIWIVLLTFGYLYEPSHGLRCYTCSVDFRSEEFSINNTCIFPKDQDNLAHCSHNSKFCKAIITRIGGVFVVLQRSCSGDDCTEACTEKGYGVRIKDCTKCCEDDEYCGATELVKSKKTDFVGKSGGGTPTDEGRWWRAILTVQTASLLFEVSAVITRICGVFVMLQRSCADDCSDSCTEKGYGVRIQDCTKCCKDGEAKAPDDCGSTELIKKK